MTRHQSWITGSLCSSTTATAVSLSDDSTTTCSSSSSTASSLSSLQSNLSLQTHPSLPSLQKSPADYSPYSSAAASPAAADFHCSNTLRPRPDLPITCLVVNGDLLYAASGHQITVYHRATGALLESFNDAASAADGGSVKAVAFLDGKAFSAHQDGKIRAWKPSAERRRHKFLAALPTAADKLRHFAFPSSYVTVRRHRKILKIQHADAVAAVAGGGGGAIYSVSWDRSLKIWSASSLRCLDSIPRAHDDAVSAVAVSTDGTVYTGSADRRIRVWSKPDPTRHRHALVATLERHKSAVNALALNDDGSVLFSGSCDRSILVWEREDSASHMAVTGALRGHGQAVLCLINVCDLLISGSADRTVRIWRRSSVDAKYGCLAVMEGHKKAVKSLAAVEGEDGVVWVYSGSLDGEVRVWQLTVPKTYSRPEIII
ncbi:unnamed protein product [Linum tenue]|uniref:Uncharacterized protein n=2 Tax=Linum tenue TaxID=586396 RepID=A0AAV0KV92_9ROSI|nr:unnamed protein product [Linum tenue]